MSMERHRQAKTVFDAVRPQKRALSIGLAPNPLILTGASISELPNYSADPLGDRLGALAISPSNLGKLFRRIIHEV